MQADVVVVGAGPAGASVALNLAAHRRVVVVERRPTASARIGESLPPAARRLLEDMGLYASFLAEGHLPCLLNRAVWGGSEAVDKDLLRDPDGHGWQLDRSRFEGWLRRAAIARGAALVIGEIETIEWIRGAWQVGVRSAQGPLSLTAQAIVDASGRAAAVARRLGARLRAEGRLLCTWIAGHDQQEPERMTYVEAVEDGWWYTAPLPGRRRILAFHGDADLMVRTPCDRGVLLERALAQHELGRVLGRAGFVPATDVAVTAAQGAALEPCTGEGWLAAGDAALRFDPLSAQGLHNALFTGLAAAEAIERHLRGDAQALAEYRATIAGIGAAYRRHLALWYGAETRWPGAPFWQRRQYQLKPMSASSAPALRLTPPSRKMSPPITRT